jgi:hypothetical protein
MTLDFSVHFVQQFECAMWRDFWRENLNSATKIIKESVIVHICAWSGINKSLFSFASNNVVMCFVVVKVLKSSLQWRRDEWNTERTWEKEMQVSCWLSKFYKMNETTKPCYIKINWCLTKKSDEHHQLEVPY